MCRDASSGKDGPRFIAIVYINIVIATNTGGAFSHFGDMTMLMVPQKGIVDYRTFLLLFIPSVVNWIVPAAIIHLAVPD